VRYCTPNTDGEQKGEFELIKTDLHPWQIILLHMQEDVTVMKDKFLIVEDGLDAEDPIFQLLNRIEADIEELYKYLDQQMESST